MPACDEDGYDSEGRRHEHLLRIVNVRRWTPEHVVKDTTPVWSSASIRMWRAEAPIPGLAHYPARVLAADVPGAKVPRQRVHTIDWKRAVNRQARDQPRALPSSAVPRCVRLSHRLSE